MKGQKMRAAGAPAKNFPSFLRRGKRRPEEESKNIIKPPLLQKKASVFSLLCFFSLSFFAGFAGIAGVAKAYPFEGTEAVVSGPSPYLPVIVRSIFREGGNLADMAVACAMSLAVTHPYYVSLGSGGLALVKMDSSIQALDFRETAPQSMGRDFYAETGLSPRKGGASVGVPGFAAGMAALHKKYGRLSWRQVLHPAIALAKKGFPVSGDWARITDKAKKRFNPSGQKIFFKNGKSYRPNEVFKQPRLAAALSLLQKKGARAVYGGPLGKDMVFTVRQNQGVMAEKDLKNYKVRWLSPVSVSFRGYQVYSMPLPSSGGIILSRALKLIEGKKLYKKNLYSGEEIHLLGEIMARAFRPRNLMGDPDFMDVKDQDWLSKRNLKKAAGSISPEKVHILPPLKEPDSKTPKESGETTHISLMDRKGRAIAMTITLNSSYGSHLVTEKYGVTLNNQMDDFSAISHQPNLYGLVQGKSNAVQGGKRPLSSMTPLIVERGGKTVLAAGGAGGPTIITGVLQTLYRHLVNGMDIDQAIQSPRIHHQFLPRSLFVESKRFSPEIMLYLKGLGHRIQYRDYIARVFAAALNKEGRLFAAHESRREGAAGGL